MKTLFVAGILVMELVLLMEIKEWLGFWAALPISLLAILGLVSVHFYLRYLVPLRKKESGYKYVYVEDDGTVHEVSEDNKAYLNTQFYPSDGARPYIKDRYNSRNGWGKISGFIPRRRVPARFIIGPYVLGSQPNADPYNC